jgi:hypothetical protein
MPKVTYDAARGLVQETGSGVVFTTDSLVFSSLPTSAVQAITTNGSTITAPGVYTVSGTSALTTVLPAPSAIPGGTIIVRAISDKAHALTGSAAVAGLNIFRSSPLATANVVGQKFTFAATVGETVTLISDGLAFCVAAGSGSITTP